MTRKLISILLILLIFSSSALADVPVLDLRAHDADARFPSDAAVLTAVNLTDELFKAQAAAEQLRGQIKGYLDEASKAQAEVSELKREVFRLQQRLDSRK